MIIGLTYDLRSEYLAMGYTEEETGEFDRDDTIEAIETALQSLGYQTDRIGNARQLIERLVKGDRWDMVFTIAEGLYGMAREAQVPTILEIYQIPYTFSDPLRMCLTLHKGMTKRIIRDAGIPTSDFYVVEKLNDINKLTFDPPFFVKPVAEGTGKGITSDSIIQDRDRLIDACQSLLEKYRQPVLVEKFLPGREFTVGILGTGEQAQAIGTVEIKLLAGAEKDVYSFMNKERCEELVEYRLVRAQETPLVPEAERISLDAWQVLGCYDAGRIDLRCDEKGQLQIMEVNPLPGLHPEHSDLPILCTQAGIPYVTLIERIMNSAKERISSQTSCR